MYTEAKLYQLCTAASEFDGKFEWQGAGMSYLVHTEQNRFVVIDGGAEEDAPKIIAKMRRLSSEKKPAVALWILTHPHRDHYGALTEIARDGALRGSLTVERLCFQLPESRILPGSGVSFETDAAKVITAEKNLLAPVITPHTGTVLDIDGIKIRFFYTPEDLSNLKDSNELSLVFKVYGPHKSAMFTGDAYSGCLNPVCYRFWNELKSDICQLAHHGLNGGSPEFYARVAADTVLIPTSAAGDKDMIKNHPYLPRFFAEKLASRSIKAYEGDAEIFL